MGQCFLYGSGSGRSKNYWISNVYGGANPPTAGVKVYDIFLRTNVALLRGELTTNVQSTPLWTDSDGAFCISLVGGAFPNTSSSAYFASNAQHKNLSISGYPGQAYIYENGGWRRCDGYIWNGSAWIQFSSVWDGTLFYNGNQYTNVTGGWSGADSYSPNLSATLYSGTITISTASAVDLSGFSTLKFMGSGNGANSGGAYSAKCKIFNESGVEVTSLDFQNNGTYAVSVAALSGKHYVRFIAQGSRGNNLNISKVWLE